MFRSDLKNPTQPEYLWTDYIDIMSEPDPTRLIDFN